MALPGSSETISSGGIIATEIVSSKEYQAVMRAHADGHLIGTRDTYNLVTPPAAAGASKLFCDIFNPSGSGVKLRIEGVFAVLDLDVASAQTVGIKIDLFRTNAVGTGGTAPTFNGTTITNANVTCLNDPAKTVLPGSTAVTSRHLPTGGATLHAHLGSHVFAHEETGTTTNTPGAYAQQADNMLVSSVIEACAPLILPEGYGILLKQGAVASAGNIGFHVIFTAA